jgi:hypothetical protein
MTSSGAAASASPRLRGEADARSAAGEGDSPQTEFAENPPHPTPLPAGGEREHTESVAGESFSESQPAHAPPPVIPLVQAPDDPGPNANAVVPPDPAPEGPDAPPADGWTRFRAMFKS